MSWQASAWALELYLGDARRKMVLVAISSYADALGRCAFPSLGTLARNCDMTEGALRRRIRELEEIGVINRFLRRIIAGGKVVSERVNGPQADPEGAGGRRTSDEFWVDMTLTPEMVADTVRRLYETKTEIAPPHEEGANANESETASNSEACNTETISPPLASGGHGVPPTQTGGPNPPHREGGIRHGNPSEESPPTPKGEWVHEKSWKKFEDAWREPILHQRLCREIWGKLTEAHRDLAILAAAGYVVQRQSQRRPPPVCNAQKLLREQEAWAGYARLVSTPAGVSTAANLYLADSPEGRAILALAAIARYSPWRMNDGRISFRGQITAQLLAMADAPAARQPYKIGSKHFASWWDLISKSFAKCPLPALTELEAPWPFAPSKEGKIYTSSTGPPKESLMTQEDEDHLERTGTL